MALSAIVFFLCGFPWQAGAQTPNVQALRADNGGAPARLRTSSEGYIRHVAAGKGRHLPLRSAAPAGANSEAVARTFLKDWNSLFHSSSPRVGWTLRQSAAPGPQKDVRLSQTYGGIPIYGAEILVQVEGGQVTYVNSDILRDLSGLDAGQPSLAPTISAADAQVRAATVVAGKKGNPGSLAASPATLLIYAPTVVGKKGAPQLVWQSTVADPASAATRRLIFIDAHTGALALNLNLIHTALNRMIYDSNNTSADPGTLVRSEGQGPSAVADANLAYDYYGDTYNFYLNEHGRDSIDGAGFALSATVRYCDPAFACPYANAFWNGSRMYFGQGFSAADDVVSHELTHGVTQFESGLIYMDQSGAINESLSDIWGEFVDLNNTGGTDTPAVRWLMGEDVPGFGAIRNMMNPPQFGHADRVTSPLYTTDPLDNGGVHQNSGIPNKLCYLLTDGDTFNGRTVTAMGYARVADLFYEAQTNLLTPSSDFMDLYDALTQSALNLGFTPEEQTNVDEGCLAVELHLEPPMPPVPAHDDCAQAYCVADGQVFLGANVSAGGGTESSCSLLDARDVWHSYTPASSGTVTITTEGSSFDTTLAVHSACGGAELACNDDEDFFGGIFTSRISTSLTGGVTYLIRVAGFDGESGPYRLLITGGGGGACPPRGAEDPRPADGALDLVQSPVLSWDLNGGFETSTFSHWTATGSAAAELLPWMVGVGTGSGFYVGAPYEGFFWAQNGFDGSAGLVYDLYREIYIPATAATANLTWSENLIWDLATFCGGCTQARQYTVTLEPAGGGAPLATLHSASLAANTTGATGYVAHAFDLLTLAGGLAGNTVRVRWNQTVPETETGPAQFDIDAFAVDFNDSALLMRPEAREREAIEGSARRGFDARRREYVQRQLTEAAGLAPAAEPEPAAPAAAPAPTQAPCPTVYDVYLGLAPGSLALIAQDLPSAAHGLTGLASDTVYYWQVVSSNCNGDATGPIWSFRTVAANAAEGWELYR